MALIMNLAALPVKFVAVPILAGLAAGTGAVAAYVAAPAAYVAAPASAISASTGTQVAALPQTSPAPAAPVEATEQATPAKSDTKLSCERQTWPYLDNRCIARGNEAGRQVRVVMAPRDGEATASAATAPNLVTSATVLRGPGVAPEANEQPVVKKAPKRSETRRQRNRAYSVYSVPSAGGTRPVIVVRPLRLDAYSSRF